QISNLESRFPQRLGCASRRNQFHSRLCQRLGQRNQSLFIGNRKQRARDLRHNSAATFIYALRAVNPFVPVCSHFVFLTLSSPLCLPVFLPKTLATFRPICHFNLPLMRG